MLTVVIPFKHNPMNLAVLLTQLQIQLNPSDDIYIVDASPKRIGLEIALRYRANRSYIFVEPTRYENYLEYGLQSMTENSQGALLCIKEDAYISATLINNIKKVIDSPFRTISPRVYKNPYPKMDTNFKLYNSSVNELVEAEDFSIDCFLLNPSEGKEYYGILKNEYVVINEKFTI